MRIQNEQAIAGVLSKVPMLRDLDETSISDLAQRASLVELQDGEALFEEGAEEGGIYLVLQGSVRLTCDTGDGPDVVVGYIEAGGIVGEMAILDPAPRSATARAAEETVVLHIPTDAFNGFLDSGHPVARVFMMAIRRMMSQRIRVLNERIGALFLIDQEMTDEVDRTKITERLRNIWAAMRSGG